MVAVVTLAGKLCVMKWHQNGGPEKSTKRKIDIILSVKPSK